MSKKRVWFTASLLVVVLLFLAACGKDTQGNESSTASGETKSDGYVIVWSPLYQGNSHQAQSLANIQEAVKNNPKIKELIVANPDGNVETQINLIRNAIDKKADAIIIQAVSETALVPVLEEAVEAGVVVINQDSLIKSDKMTSKVYVDDTEWSRITGEWLVDKLGKKGKVVVLNGLAGNTTNRDRWENAEKVLKGTEGIEVLAETNADWAQAKAQSAVASWLAAYPQIDGVWSQGGEMTSGAILEFEKANRPMVPMVGEAYNGFLKLWAKHKDKGFSSIAPALPNYNVLISLEVALRALEGKEVPKNVLVPLPMVTDETLSNYVQPDKADDYWVFDKLAAEEIDKIITDNK
ncbi:ABC transporter substrate-binding protein [Cohnella faecalis]|nr:ABC transporter substrate-binding protein [Cohnella faecalis]